MLTWNQIDCLENYMQTHDYIAYWQPIFRDYLLSIDSEFDPAHKIDHVDRVTKTALELAEQEQANIKVVLPAVMLHECVAVDKFSAKRSQASTICAHKAIELLTQWDHPSEYFAAIEHAIMAHSFSANIAPQTLEAKIVQDADRLDSLGVIGFARMLAVGFANKNPLYHANEPFPVDREAQDHKYIIDHYYQKLCTLASTMQTQSGLAEAQKRQRTMEWLLKSLHDEITVTASSFGELIRPYHPAQ